MKNLLTTLALLAGTAVAAQTEKGASPLNPQSAIANPQSVRAVVVGISDYQDKDIPDLRFADRDAEAFANFLRSPAGGSLDGDHLKLLTNKDATTAQFDAALGWLMDESKEGDQAIIYFSGHGDVETKTRSQQGFLLCWDSPPQAYVSGAYPIFFLKEVVSTLSMENKARVIVITDACRSGKLAGNAVGGSQLTSQNLAQQFANEIKILSCQPNEYSIEGEQWGGGRGAFSFHLVEGLYGMADGNADASVNLMEIGRYLDDHVTTEVAPQSQVPMTVGNRTECLAAVFPDLLAQVRKNKAGQLPTFSPTDSRGIEEDVLATVDTTVRELYRLFKKALKDKVFLEPANACADAYYERLIAEPKMERLHNAMRRNYAAALQDDAQQSLNAILRSDPYELGKNPDSYDKYSDYLNRAVEILGPQHYMFKSLKSKQGYFKAKTFHQINYPDLKPGELEANKLEVLNQSLSMDSTASYIYNLIGSILVAAFDNPQKAMPYLDKATALSPTWALAWKNLGRCLNAGGMTVEAELAYFKAVQLDSFFLPTYIELASMYQEAGNLEASKYWCEKLVLKMEQYRQTHTELPLIYYRDLGVAFNWLGNYKEAESNLLKTLEMTNPSQSLYYQVDMGLFYVEHKKFDEAIFHLNKALVLNPNFDWVHYNLALAYWGLNDTIAFEQTIQNAINILPESPYMIACIYSIANQYKALEWLEIAFKNGYVYSETHDAHKLLNNLQQTDGFKKLMKKYFPDQAKD